MLLDQAIREAIASNEPGRLAQVVDFMQFRLGWSYAKCRDAAKRSAPGLTDDLWEGFMLAIDNGEPTLHGPVS